MAFYFTPTRVSPRPSFLPSTRMSLIWSADFVSWILLALFAFTSMGLKGTTWCSAPSTLHRFVARVPYPIGVP